MLNKKLNFSITSLCNKQKISLQKNVQKVFKASFRNYEKIAKLLYFIAFSRLLVFLAHNTFCAFKAFFTTLTLATST